VGREQHRYEERELQIERKSDRNLQKGIERKWGIQTVI
jgi:hypothetical protein